MDEVVFKFKEGDRVQVKHDTRWDSDREHGGRVGKIVGEPWNNPASPRYPTGPDITGNVYSVRFVSGERKPIFEDDLETEDRTARTIEWHRVEIARLEKEAREKEATEAPKKLGTGSSIFFEPSQLVIKVAEDKWHWYHISDGEMQYHSISEDKAVVTDIADWGRAGKKYEVFPADQD